MKRNLDQLPKKEYDLLIIGGGIYGATLAWEGASRGLSVVLVEKGDFGHATSANSLKTIHGGLRYLQHGHFMRMRESIRERKILLKIAPHFVHPVSFLMPTYGFKKGKMMMRLAFFLNDLIGYDRNRNTEEEKRIPNGKVISKLACIEKFSQVNTKGLTGGAVWLDGYVSNPERLVLSFLLSATKFGAKAYNYLKVIKLLEDDHKVKGAVVRDEFSNEEIEIRAKVTVNAAGPWVDEILNLSRTKKTKKIFHPSVAINIVTSKVNSSSALALNVKTQARDSDGLMSKGSRLLIWLPWRNHSLIGTAHIPYSKKPDDFKIEESDLKNFLTEANASKSSISVKREDIKYVLGGILPAEANGQENGQVELKKQYEIYDHKKDGLDGLISVLGVKYTTARDIAEKVIDHVSLKIDSKPVSSSVSKSHPVAGGDMKSFEDYLSEETEKAVLGVTPFTINHLIRNYGTDYLKILKLADEDPALKEKIDEKSPMIKAQIIYSIREEMAQKLTDVIFRRTEAGTLGTPGESFINSCASVMGKELGWDDDRKKAEMMDVNIYFQSRR